MASSSNIWWQILAGNPHDCSWSHFPDYPSSSEPCIPCQPCSCPPCPTESFWVRPEEWPVLPEFSSDVDQRIVGLVAVEDTDLEVLAILCQGAYTVDWGDGSAPENVASGVKAQHRYTYADITTNPLSYGYKTVIVTVTPQAGNNLTDVDLVQRHSDAGNCFVMNKWLALDLSIPYCDYLLLYAGSGSVAGRGFPRLLEQVILREHAIIDMAGLFSHCHSLQSVEISDTSAVQDMTDMFFYCLLLQSIPALNTTNVTSTGSIVAYCHSLLCFPEIDTANVDDMWGMFDSCYSLQCVQPMDTAKVVYMEAMFNNCVSLSCLPLLDTGSVRFIAQMFRLCTSMLEVPMFDWSAVNDSASMYLTFAECHALQRLPNFNTAKVQSLSQVVSYCESLSQLPAWDCSTVYIDPFFLGRFYGARALCRSNLYGLRYGNIYHSYEDMPMSADALNSMFTNLGVAAGTQYVVITNCYGAADPACDRTIATAKGWTVIG